MGVYASVQLQQFAAQLRCTFARDEGQDMVEYALLLGLLTLGTIAIVILVGPVLKNTFQTVVNELGSA